MNLPLGTRVKNTKCVRVCVCLQWRKETIRKT